MKKAELGQVLANIPGMVSDITFGLMGETGKNPRFPSVLKRVKEELMYLIFRCLMKNYSTIIYLCCILDG